MRHYSLKPVFATLEPKIKDWYDKEAAPARLTQLKKKKRHT